jgi:protein ImuB
VALRIDQAFGHAFELLDPLLPKEMPSRRVVFAEPIGRLEDLKAVVLRVAQQLCRDLESASLGVRRLDLIFERVDRRSVALRIGTAKATRDAKHLSKLFDEHLQTIDPGFGIEGAILLASKVEPLSEKQVEVSGLRDGADEEHLSHLVDRLGARIGPRRVYRLAPVESRVPERSMQRIPALAPPTGLTWPRRLPRPTRLIDPPEAVTATALLPDHPPAFFIWRRVRHRVMKADGPERISGEWWRNGSERSSLRDYYRVENENGARFWLFRDAPADQGGRWWLHGLFA